MYCKNCGAYIPTESSKCEECGTVNGITPLMRLQKAIKNNDSIDDIIENRQKMTDRLLLKGMNRRQRRQIVRQQSRLILQSLKAMLSIQTKKIILLGPILT